MCKRKNKVNSKSNEKKFFLSFSVFGAVPVVSCSSGRGVLRRNSILCKNILLLYGEERVRQRKGNECCV